MTDGGNRETPANDQTRETYNPYAPTGGVPHPSDTGSFGAAPSGTGQFPPAGGQRPTAPYGQTPGAMPSATRNPFGAPSPNGPMGAGGPNGPTGPTVPFGPGGPLGPGGPAAPGQSPKSGSSGKKLLVGGIAVALLAGGIGGGVGAIVANQNSSDATSTQVASGPTVTTQPKAAPGSVQDTASRVLPSVVSITVANGREVGSGSGVVLSSDGVILTNNHVVAGSNVQVLVSFTDGSRAMARVLGADPLSDIAVIKADKTGLTPITIGTSKNLSVGQDVIAIGSPLGLEGTVTTGIISSLNRPVSTSASDGSGSESVIDAIQTDAAINPGNSGGALINSSGALIGINSAIMTLGQSGEGSGSIGLGFAIPVDQAMRVANQLRETGRATHSSIGVSVRPNTDLARPGALVASVVRGGPADRAGIPTGALITGVDDRKIATSDALVAAVRSYAPGVTVKVTYEVNGQTRTAQAKLDTK